MTDQADEDAKEAYVDRPIESLGCTEDDNSMEPRDNEDSMGQMDTMKVQISALVEVSEKDVERASNTPVMPDASMVPVEGNSKLGNIRTIKEFHGRVPSPEMNEKGYDIPDAAVSPMMTSDMPTEEGSLVDKCEVAMHVLQKCIRSRETVGEDGVEDSSMEQVHATQIEEYEILVQETWELCKEDKRKTKKAALQATRQSSRLKIQGFQFRRWQQKGSRNKI
jgi:hypothetical protein